MLKGLQKRWKNLSTQSNNTTPICKICFSKIKRYSLNILFNNKVCICNKCRSELDPRFIKFKVDKIPCLSIYEYNEHIKSLIYQLKGCGDIEISQVFLSDFASVYHLYFKGFILVPAPSFYLDDERRGFNHVIEIFEQLQLPYNLLFTKTDNIKQSDQHISTRKEIANHLKIDSYGDVKKQKILLVDDIYTTGSTILSMIKMIEVMKPKKIAVLTIAKVTTKNAKT